MDKAYAALSAFDLPLGKQTLSPLGNGHINGTFRLRVEGQPRQWVLQRINDYVFKRPDEVQQNIDAVCSFLREVILREGGDPDRETLSFLKTRDGGLLHRDAEGNYWRLGYLVEHAVSKDLPDSPDMFRECGAAFGRFQRRLADFPVSTLFDTIPRFHDTPNRLANLERSVRECKNGRVKDVSAELAFIRERAGKVSALLDGVAAGELPIRVTHNDTKLNNVLLDEDTGKALCVLDLDTVMAGLAAYDFGEAIRTGAATAMEDEPDLSKVSLDMTMFRAFAGGYLSEMAPLMSDKEKGSLPLGAWMMSLENGIRFLADHLDGDIYYKIDRENHNLDRCRVQLKMVSCLEARWDEMQSVIRDL